MDQRTNYQILYQYLQKQDWNQADIQTREIMLSIAQVENREDILLTKSDLDYFSCQELKKINSLWLEASRGKYGFSVIYDMYKLVNCDYKQLAKLTGWRINNYWINYEQIDFSDHAPQGHLPLTWVVPKTFSMYWLSRFASAGWTLLLNRWEKCC